MRLIDADEAMKFLRESKVKETGAFSKGINKGLNIALSALGNSQITPTVEAVVLQFKIGVTAFFLNRYHRKVWPIMICSAEINSQGVSQYGCGGLCPDSYTPVFFTPSEIGESVFFTQEEAEAALAKMKGGADNA